MKKKTYNAFKKYSKNTISAMYAEDLKCSKINVHHSNSDLKIFKYVIKT